jgi:hypothetical protein
MSLKTVSKKATKAPKALKAVKTDKQSVTLDSIIIKSNKLALLSPLRPPP